MKKEATHSSAKTLPLVWFDSCVLIACEGFASFMLLFIKEQSMMREIRGQEEREKKKERRILTHM